ncbi:MAG: hypothetical protein JW795_23420 [Chitinivibrionales bacterium]|nr:hypothetical protein [Chitinivibrionales bacterium]
MKKKGVSVIGCNTAMCTGIFLFVYIHAISGCGGGVMPYIPTQSGGGNQEQKAEFYILDKGVTSDMMNMKKLQPLLKNIVYSGNERKKAAPSKNQAQQNQAAADTTVAQTPDSAAVLSDHSHLSHCSPNPVLNLHYLH